MKRFLIAFAAYWLIPIFAFFAITYYMEQPANLTELFKNDGLRFIVVCLMIIPFLFIFEIISMFIRYLFKSLRGKYRW